VAPTPVPWSSSDALDGVDAGGGDEGHDDGVHVPLGKKVGKIDRVGVDRGGGGRAVLPLGLTVMTMTVSCVIFVTLMLMDVLVTKVMVGFIVV